MTTMDRSVLIAGCGYLGHRVALQWKDDSTVWAMTRSSDRAKRFTDEGLCPLQIDLAYPDNAVDLPAVDTVLWAVGYDRSTGLPREQTWIDGLRWLLHNLPAPPRRFLYVSSTSVYGPGNGEIVDETSRVDPVTEGARCCVAAESLLLDFAAARMPDTQVSILRLAGIFGPHRLLRRISELMQGQPLTGNPDQWLNLIHVDDAVRTITAVRHHSPHIPLINVVNSGTLTRRDYYQTLAECVGAPPARFVTDESGTTPDTKTVRGGNRRVVSVVRPELNLTLAFDDVRSGLVDAVQRSEFSS